MKKAIKLSVVISAFNEEEKIKDCLESVVWADEIIFIDNSSTDATVRIAEKFVTKIFTRPNNLMLNVNKNFGFSKASGEWILCLDADERISAELKEEILSVIAQENSIKGYWISRKNIIFKKWIQHAGWYPDHQMRLFKKGFGKFEELHVHEMIKLEGEAGYLKNHLIHENYESIAHFIDKMITIYAPNEAKELIRKGYKLNYLDSIRFPAREFISRFFAREGYKDGFHGFILSLLMAFYHFIVFTLIWEQEQFRDVDNADFLSEIKEELVRIIKEIKYWMLKERIKKTKSFFLKLLLKIKSKI